MDAPLLAPDDRRVAPDRRRADPERTARLAGVAPQRPVRVLGGVWPEESLGPRVHLRGGTGSGRTTSRLERVVVCRCERHPSGGNRSVSRGHPGPRRSLEPGEGLSRPLSSSPCFRFFDQGHPMALRWGLGFAVMSIMVAFAANSVMTRYIIVGGLATPYLLSTVRFASGFAMLLTLQVAFPGPASRVPTALAGLPVLGLFAPSAVSVQLTWNGIGLALFMGMITTALSYIVWNATLRRLSASQGGIVQLLVPVLASGMGIALLGEHVTLSLVVGGASVLAGIYLTRVQPK